MKNSDYLAYRKFRNITWIATGILLMVVLVMATTTISDSSSVFGSNNTYNGTNTFIRLSNSESNIDLRPFEIEGGSAISFWSHPIDITSHHEIAKITGHGNSTGSNQSEMGFYTNGDDGSLNLRMKIRSGENKTFLIFGAGLSGITTTNGKVIDFGQDSGGGNSHSGFHGDIALNNTKIRALNDAPIQEVEIEESTIRLDGTNTFIHGSSYLAYEPTFKHIKTTSSSSDSLFSFENSNNDTIWELRDDNGVFKLNSASNSYTVLTAYENKIIKLTANNSAILCNSTHEGGIYYDTDTNKHYGCDGSTWNALY